jgi:predicted P-loop ATPase
MKEINHQRPSIMDVSKKTKTTSDKVIAGKETAKKPSLIKTSSAPEKINSLKFPQRNEAEKPLGTIENIEYMLKYYRIEVAYNNIKKDIVISIPGLTSGKDNYQNVAEAELVSIAVHNGIYSTNFERFIFAIANRNQINPIMEWIESKPWDGKDRLVDFCATIVVEDAFPNDFKNLLMNKWLLSAVAATAMPKEFSSRGVLTLQGPQGIGKTRWIAALINDDKLQKDCILLDHHMDANNKDAQIAACKHWLVEIGELDSSFKKDIARLKGWITKSEDKIRIPYAKRESVFSRRTVFAATVNEAEFLIDPTGNTRWWTLPCTDINHNHTIDMQQLWAQIYEEMFKNVESPQWWLTDDEQNQLEALNSHHKKRTAIEDLLESELLFDAPKEDWVRLSASDVLKVVGIHNPTNPQAKECANFLRQRIGQPTRSRGYVRWLIPPISEALQPLGKPLQPLKKPIHDEDDDSKY